MCLDDPAAGLKCTTPDEIAYYSKNSKKKIQHRNIANKQNNIYYNIQHNLYNNYYNIIYSLNLFHYPLFCHGYHKFLKIDSEKNIFNLMSSKKCPRGIKCLATL